ncbi:MAG: ThuA domain-containing protein [Anaerolineae bacterium]|nr:ThuA domain-containing protein [Anaerolineae bacterium]
MNPRVTVWHEFRHEKKNPKVAEIYPEGMHIPIANYLREQGLEVQTATLDEPEHGLTEEVLANTDVLTWWGHMAHNDVSDEIVKRVQDRVLDGMGLIVLHSGHFSKIFTRLMGSTCNLKWREADDRERIWVVEPGHPIAKGLPPYFEIEREEMYGERFDIPAPDTLVFVSWFEGGEVFRSGCCYQRGKGKIFYFRPGHETYPTYYHPQVLQVIHNGVMWAAPDDISPITFGNSKPLEKISEK